MGLAMVFKKHQKTLKEAIEQECEGFNFSGHGFERDIHLQLTKAQSSGLGVKVAANSADLELPSSTDLEGRIVLKWEGHLCDTREKAIRETYFGPDGKKAEVVEVADKFFSPVRCAAQLVACATITYSLADLRRLSFQLGVEGDFDIEHTDSNCALEILEVGPNGESWPCIVQTKRIKRNEHLRYLYTSNMKEDLFRCIVQWSKDTHDKPKADRDRNGSKVDSCTNRQTKRRRGKGGQFILNED